ncbi:hemerythrin domain-containing protein [Nordella sp. HKS 07]|uniref:hemerythrin domain-containing protein n=1 Tax=Nordella sp. HKS 07 TaxID=2712222 RepID=UPI0013E147CC|nr:hemerythrin domain-containing protein [Nordella sp. HKS 07]QIG50522.1 hemerythrin domain-containing protein [Nordella sp. HKS 07]
MRQEAWSCRVLEACPAGAVCRAGEHVPCIDLARLHAEKLELCAALEAIADDLPARVDRLKCLTIASTLVPLLRACHRLEEEAIFPAFIAERGEARVIARLTAEHLEDDSAAEDLTEMLLAIGHGAAVSNPEAFGYMLRAFFEAMRRHIAFERDHILTAIGCDG